MEKHDEKKLTKTMYFHVLLQNFENLLPKCTRGARNLFKTYVFFGDPLGGGHADQFLTERPTLGELAF